MFSKKCLFVIFAVSFLGASDSKKESSKNNHDTIKKVAACGIGELGIIVSE